MNASQRLTLFGSIFILLALVVSYVCAPLFPITAGWENGWIENAQVVLLILGGVWALRLAAGASHREKVFWQTVAPFWFIFALRELSWGTVFIEPLSMSPITGPVYSSTQQLWYRPAVVPVMSLILLVCAWRFFRSGQMHTLAILWRQRSIPLRELLLSAICMFISASLEGHMMLHFDLSRGAAQVFEESVEFWAYSALLLAQMRIMMGLRADASTTMG